MLRSRLPPSSALASYRNLSVSRCVPSRRDRWHIDPKLVKNSLLRQYLRRVRAARSAPRAFVRMEPAPGERFEIDWGHFGSLDYQGDKRKL